MTDDTQQPVVQPVIPGQAPVQEPVGAPAPTMPEPAAPLNEVPAGAPASTVVPDLVAPATEGEEQPTGGGTPPPVGQ